MLLLVAVVVMRALFDQPLRGQVDFVTMMVPSLAFLGLSYCYRLGGPRAHGHRAARPARAARASWPS